MEILYNISMFKSSIYVNKILVLMCDNTAKSARATAFDNFS